MKTINSRQFTYWKKEADAQQCISKVLRMYLPIVRSTILDANPLKTKAIAEAKIKYDKLIDSGEEHGQRKSKSVI